MAKIDQLFQLMVQQKASDLHLTSGAPPFFRVHGHMQPLDMPVLNNEDVQSLIFEILSEKQKRLFVENWELDCAYAIEDLARFRCNVFMQRKGIGAVFRQIPTTIRTAEELNLPEEILKLSDCHKGLICVTGPTGSGKSTTLAAIIDHINRTRQGHIITIEDPVEFVHKNNKCLVNQREVGGHTKSFANALKATLREDPDIILVGEMRDIETIGLALTAAETGHLVFGTLHTSSAHKTVDRIIDVFPEDRQAQVRVMLSESLRGVVAQTLLQKEGGGRVGAYEILFNTKAVSNLIREGKTFQIPSAMQTARSQGCITLEVYIDMLLSKKLITQATAEESLGRPLGAKKEDASGLSLNAPTTPASSGGSSPNSGGGRPPAPPSAPAAGGLSGFANRFKKTS